MMNLLRELFCRLCDRAPTPCHFADIAPLRLEHRKSVGSHLNGRKTGVTKSQKGGVREGRGRRTAFSVTKKDARIFFGYL